MFQCAAQASVLIVGAICRQRVVLGRLIVGRRQEMEQQRLLRDLEQTEGLEHNKGSPGGICS